MYIIAGEHNLPIIRYDVRRDNGVGLILNLEVARDSISIGDLDAIVQKIGREALDITVYDENDEKTAILTGFHCEPNLVARGGSYKVELINASENTFQLGRQLFMIEQLENVTANQNGKIIEHEDAINKQSEVIEEQNEKMFVLEESDTMQISTIESILLEVIPSVVETAITEAISSLVGAPEEPTEEVAEKPTELPVDETVE